MRSRRYQWTGIIALLLVTLLWVDSIAAYALASEEILGVGEKEDQEQYIDDEEIWARIDKKELRSLVDVEMLQSQIDEAALRRNIDKDELEKNISNTNLLRSISADEILREFNEKKQSGELDNELSMLSDDAMDVGEDGEVQFDPESEATEEGGDGAESETNLADVVSIQYPIVGERSPFDFIIDPLGLVYSTTAAKYGGGKVEEAASVLFRNTNGDYDFSSQSDLLKIVNKSNVPVKVQIRAIIKNSGSVKVVDDLSTLSDNDAGLYFALVDENGFVSVFTEGDEAVIDTVLEPVPDGTYTFEWNEEQKKYDHVLAENVDESVFDYFSFGVTASCNKNGNWGGLDSLPVISVTWKTEPIYTDWDSVSSELDETDKQLLEAFKKLKLQELRAAELERLVQIALDELISEELDRLIDLEVEKLAQEKFKELKELAMRGELPDDASEDDSEDDASLGDTEDEEYPEDDEDVPAVRPGYPRNYPSGDEEDEADEGDTSEDTGEEEDEAVAEPDPGEEESEDSGEDSGEEETEDDPGEDPGGGDVVIIIN